MHGIPESPESIALCLLGLILQRCSAEASDNRPPAQQILDLYKQCLGLVRTKPVTHEGPRITDSIH